MTTKLKIRVTPEGRENIWIPEKESLVDCVKGLGMKKIHNFIPSGAMMLGADHDLASVLDDIRDADRLAIFTDPSANMGHALAVIKNESLQCFDIGKITLEDIVKEETH